MFTPKSPLPPGTERDRLYSRIELDENKSSFELFPSAPGTNESVQNYDKIPLATNKNVIFLALSLKTNLKMIVQDANIDPAQVVNTLADGILKITTNQKKTTELRYPIQDVLNFNNVTPSYAYDSTADSKELAVSLPSTGMRPIDQLFYVEDQETWGMTVEFNAAGFPAKANWPNEPLAIIAEIPIAKVTDPQLQQYRDRLKRDRGYGG